MLNIHTFRMFVEHCVILVVLSNIDESIVPGEI